MNLSIFSTVISLYSYKYLLRVPPLFEIINNIGNGLPLEPKNSVNLSNYSCPSSSLVMA